MYKKLADIFILSFAFLFFSCTSDDSSLFSESEEEAMLNMSIKTMLTADPLNKGGDGSFSSLAIFIFNTNGYCEYSELVPDFSPQAQEYSRSVRVSNENKIIYAIANYNNPTIKTISTPISTSMTMAQLDGLIVENNSFSSSNIMMVGKKAVTMNSNYVTAEVPLERLVARVDIYMFKSQQALNDVIEVTSVKFVNQTLNTRCAYENTTMISPAIRTTTTGAIASNLLLSTMPSDLSGIVPDNAHTSFYSYQNIIPSTSSPDDDITPYLEVTFKFNNQIHIAKGYLTDNGQTVNKYSLMRNTVYRVMAMVDQVNNKLELKVTVAPWDVSDSGIGFGIKDTDYVLNPFGSNNAGAVGGYVQYPYAVDGAGVDGTSYASYSFKLIAPKGAVWTATLTNGLDFTFGSNGSVAGKNAVSTGIARTDEYEIKVGATKSWGGTTRKTLMYITVDGVRLKINPIVSGTTRKYPGTTDTEIEISQTKYQ